MARYISAGWLSPRASSCGLLVGLLVAACGVLESSAQTVIKYRICIDPGHGNNTGTQGTPCSEDEVNLSVGLALAELLGNDRRHDFSASVTRIVGRCGRCRGPHICANLEILQLPPELRNPAVS